MEKRRVWNREETNILIENVKLHPELWNVNCKGFKNRIKKQRAIIKLAEMFNTTECEIQRKLHNLRTQLNQEWRKIQKKRSEQLTNEECKSSWEFFDALKFILVANIESFTEDNLTHAEEVLEVLVDTQNLIMNAEEASNKELKIESSKNGTKRKYKQIEDDVFSANDIKIMDRSLDDFQIFGDYVASELRSLGSDQHQRMLKRKIQRAILEVSELADEEQFGTSTYETSTSNTIQPSMKP